MLNERDEVVKHLRWFLNFRDNRDILRAAVYSTERFIYMLVISMSFNA